MNDNTQEKNLIEKSEENIFAKIKSFLKKFFRKKELETSSIVDENIEMEMEKSNAFRDTLKDFENVENNVFELQRRYRKGEIADSDLTQEQINKLCQLYDSQIADLKRNIISKEQQLAKYKNNNKQRIEENNM